VEDNPGDVRLTKETLKDSESETANLAPGEEAAYGSAVGLSGVRVADLGGEELDEPPPCPLAGLLDDGGRETSPVPTTIPRRGSRREIVVGTIDQPAFF
jgi:hypothetical protein